MSDSAPQVPPAEQSGRGGEGRSGRPARSFDATSVARAAQQRDPGLPYETAVALADRAWEHLYELDEPDAPEIARRLLAEDPAIGATPAAVIASVIVDFASGHESAG